MKRTIRTTIVALLAVLSMLVSQAGHLPTSASPSGQAGKVTAPGGTTSTQAVTPTPPASANQEGDKAMPPPVAPPRSAAQACTPAATQVQGADHVGNNELFDVAGTSSADLWAVGTYFNTATRRYVALAEHWDGARWAHVPALNPGVENHLRGITSVGPGDVWAVGDFVEANRSVRRTLIEHWDGAQWSIVSSPNVSENPSYPSNYLSAVAAVSASDVWAVGNYSLGGHSHPLFLHWDGAQWSVVPGPQGLTGDAFLTSVSAISATDVWAAGYLTFPSSNRQALLMHWNGVSWTQVPSPGDPMALYGIDAVSHDDVWAVGATSSSWPYGVVLIHWDGNEWSRVPGPAEGLHSVAESRLDDVVALSANDVWAVGRYHDNFGKEHTLTVHWDGSEWSVVTGPDTITSGPNNIYSPSLSRLNAVTGFSPGEVWAVGSQGIPQTLVERWNGSEWSIVPSADPGIAFNELHAIAAASPDDIWAVGYYQLTWPTYSFALTLIEHWDGSAWSIIPSPNVPISENYLRGVEAISPNDVWAVGSSGVGGSGDYSALAMHWDGSEWSIVPTHNGTPSGEGDNTLMDVDGVSSDDVWAVGAAEPLDVEDDGRPLIEHWNGSEWSLISVPGVPGVATSLVSVTAIATDDVWAVGSAVGSTGVRPFAMHWDGVEWSIAQVPQVEYGWLNGVAALASDDVWAVGGTNPVQGQGRTLTMHWDGSQWSEVSSPNIEGANTGLLDVSALSPDNVWAVGNYLPTPDALHPVFMRWNGAGWQVVSVPEPSATDAKLSKLVALSPTDVWAVGRYNNMGGGYTLIEHVGRFGDVAPTDYYYDAVNYLVAHGVVSGYNDDCTFRPGNHTSRGQVAKMAVLAEGWAPLDPGSHTFADVPPGSPFYGYVEAIASRHIVGGYACGSPGEPCDEQRRPYFRPGAQVSRGQLAKIVVLVESWALVEPATPTFADVPKDSAFYSYVETALSHGILGGYGCGNPEPCDPSNRPYFRPGNPATRGQVAKIIYNAVVSP